MADVFVYDAVRTPFGRYGGALAGVRPDDLAALVVRALVRRSPDLDPARVDEIVFGCANGAGEDNRNVGRMAGLLAGLPDSSGGVTLNRLCGSGLDAVAMAARSIRGGDASLIIAGGSESMHLMYLMSIAAATKTIDIAASYFVPDTLITKALIAARQRGVKVD